ncbi:archaeosine biosynthesis radical SAM protein RaSEA [Methanomassiliicoccus luminyensis]|uniref:archaeosine biosynthesis radical SAM protein RaSEA n=1 Tax=Methanomassiliicoccus luminyensis TaxID=1080712 RepID=UPI0011C729C5|nr:archaeosine biosynthesis radical SAM protein RaSEA [Methanomassiliicoccus luminyensis]
MARLTREELQVPVSMWREEDMIAGERAEAFVLIFRTTGCWWSYQGGCLMCGYNAASSRAVTIEDLKAQLAKATERYRGERMVKLYTSGSFLDENEVPPEVRDEVFSAFGKADRILFESRPEFITDDSLSRIDCARSAIAIGLESSNEEILRKSVRKGFTVADYTRAAEVMLDRKVPLRTYLLLKPPYLTERAAVEDAISSIQYSSQFSESVSVNPVNVQRDTVVEALWRRGNYRPPYLWSLVEVLRQGKEVSGCRVMSSPSGGGTARGVHNCDRCDRKILDAVQRFSFNQDAGEFEGLQCGCRKEWAAVMDVQDTMGTSVDISRYLSSELEFD